MKFSCSKCETKYSIADEKVKGKVLKIRCKKCENVIVLREPKEELRGEEPTRAVALDPATLASLKQGMPNDGAVALPAGGGAKLPPNRMMTGTNMPVVKNQPVVAPQARASQANQTVGSNALAAKPQEKSAAAAAPAPAAGGEWYLAVKGQQIGPVTLKQIRDKFVAKEIDERTYGWRDGMGDWKRLPDIPEIKPFLVRAAPPPPPPAASPPPPPVDDGAESSGSGAQVVDLQAEIARRKGKGAVEGAPAAGDPLAALLDDAGAPTEVSLGSHPLGEPEAPAASDAAPADASATAPASGDPFASVPDSSAAASGPPRESTKMFIAAAGLKDRSKKHKVYAGIGVMMTLGLATVLYLDATGIYEIPIAHELVSVGFAALDIEPPPARERVEGDDGTDISGLFGRKKTEEGPKRARRKGGGGPGLPSDKDGVDLAAALAGAQLGGGIGNQERVSDSAAQDVKSDLQASLTLKSMLNAEGRKAVDVKVGAAPVDARNLVKSIPVDTPLKPEQISKTVADNMSSLRGCGDEAVRAGEKFKGTLTVTVTIVPSGRIKSASVNDPKMASTTLGQCVGRALKRWVFPSFQGEAFDAELPLKLDIHK